MARYRIVSLYSGSSGNAFLIETPSTCILIDAGKNAKALVDALGSVGVTPDRLDAIFLTHDHHDHTAALPVFLKRYPMPVHVVEASAQAITAGAMDQAWVKCLCPHRPLYEVSVGDVIVRSFITPHDSCFSVGYRLELAQEWGRTRAIGYATDLGYVTDEVKAALMGCESVVLESNHDVQMLLTGPYPRRLKERILSRYGHLSNENCAVLAAELAEHGMKRLMLAHLSEQNNTPELAYNEALMALGGYGVDLMVAAPVGAIEMHVGEEEKERELC